MLYYYIICTVNEFMLCYFQLELFCNNINLPDLYTIINRWLSQDASNVQAYIMALEVGDRKLSK